VSAPLALHVAASEPLASPARGGKRLAGSCIAQPSRFARAVLSVCCSRSSPTEPDNRACGENRWRRNALHEPGQPGGTAHFENVPEPPRAPPRTGTTLPNLLRELVPWPADSLITAGSECASEAWSSLRARGPPASCLPGPDRVHPPVPPLLAETPKELRRCPCLLLLTSRAQHGRAGSAWTPFLDLPTTWRSGLRSSLRLKSRLPPYQGGCRRRPCRSSATRANFPHPLRP
jgi:hypothetical protein